MPPKPKFTKEEIVTAALGVVSQSGINALTAKSLGNALNTSATPIFTVFNSMQEVQDAVKVAAMERFESYAHKTSADMPIFKQVGMQMILFAKEEPQLYQLIFMSQNSDVKSFEDIYAHLGGVADECLNTIQKDYSLSAEDAKTLFEHSWIHTYGIGTLCATGMCDFTQTEISQMLTQDFTAMMMLFLDDREAKKVIRTERLILRPWRSSDAESLYEYAKDPAVGPIAGWQPHTSVEESLSVIQNVLSGSECYAICEKENGKAIGCIELRLNGHTDMTDKDDECELGYWLGKPFWGRGYMPEAAKAILRHAFEDIGMTRVWCGYYDGNRKSKRVQEKLGFMYHHTCDHVPVPLMNEVRIGHTNVMTYESWAACSV